MRSLIIGLLGKFCSSDPEIVAEAKRRYDLHWTEPAALPSEIKTTVYKIVLKTGGKTEYDAIKQVYYNTSDNAERKHVFMSLGAVADNKLKSDTLDWVNLIIFKYYYIKINIV